MIQKLASLQEPHMSWHLKASKSKEGTKSGFLCPDYGRLVVDDGRQHPKVKLGQLGLCLHALDKCAKAKNSTGKARSLPCSLVSHGGRPMILWR